MYCRYFNDILCIVGFTHCNVVVTVITNCISNEDNAVGSVHLSACLFPAYMFPVHLFNPSNCWRWPFACAQLAITHLGLKVKVKGQSAVSGDSFNSSQLLNFSIRDLNHFV